jgi:hypothetical protein
VVVDLAEKVPNNLLELSELIMSPLQLKDEWLEKIQLSGKDKEEINVLSDIQRIT